MKYLAEEILEGNNLKEQRALFSFDSTDSNESVLLKFLLWTRFFYIKFFSVNDAPFHSKMDGLNLSAYRAEIKSFTNLAFRGASKSTRTKLFIAYCIANDRDRFRKYIKILSHDKANCKQFVTDIYNLLIQLRVRQMYPEIFEKTVTKREETMESFTTSTGIKVLADTVGSSQRGSIQEEARPDFIIFDDIETRETLRSAVKTKTIWDNMQEAKDGLSINGACVYLGNYISEMGNIHQLVLKEDTLNRILIVPIIEKGEITWSDRYTKEDIEYLKTSSDDFEGEYLCKPNASKDIYFDRERLDNMEIREPIKEIAGFKIFRNYDPLHRYAGGCDVAGGLGLDSSASVFIDFDTIPSQVVATFSSNTIQPEAFGDEIHDEANRFGSCLVAIENNKYDQAVLKAKQLGTNLYKSIKGATLKLMTTSQPTYEWGWNTNSLTKSKMFSALKQAVNDGLLVLNDKDLTQEAKSYTRNDMIDKEEDARLTTRHFDLLTACAIAWQMKDKAEYNKEADREHYLFADINKEPSNPAE
jgi:hypothetical protein